MPIDYSEYHPKWKLISYLIRVVRAKNCCEQCGIKNYSVVKRFENNRTPHPNEAYYIRQETRRGYSFAQALKKWGFTKIVLTVAHLDHNKKNNRFWNLKALCQKCHLSHDMDTHVANRKYGRNHKEHQQLKLEL